MIWQFLSSNLLWSQGYTLFLFLLAFMIFFYLIYRPFYYLTLLVFIFCLWFFRNPVRSCPELAYDHAVIISPADGKVVEILFDDTLPNGYYQKISIVLSLLDVHVTWSPVRGMVSALVYSPGTFSYAWLPKSSLLNEHNDITLLTERADMVMVRQIAGTIARRIRTFVTVDQAVMPSQPIGMICFGSRVELFLPRNAEIMVGLGQHVYGGQTVIAKWLR
jgi:phosphatidylserine decarboxylase